MEDSQLDEMVTSDTKEFLFFPPASCNFNKVISNKILLATIIS